MVIGWSTTRGDTHRGQGGSVLDTLLRSDLVVWALKLPDGCPSLGLNTEVAHGDIEEFGLRRSLDIELDHNVPEGIKWFGFN